MSSSVLEEIYCMQFSLAIFFFHACGSGIKKVSTFAPGEVAEWSIAPVLKTGACNRAGGSNPSLSADKCKGARLGCLFSLPLLESPRFLHCDYRSERDHGVIPPSPQNASKEAHKRGFCFSESLLSAFL